MDIFLATLLIVAIPALALYRSFRPRRRKPTRTQRYLNGIVLAGALLLLLGFAWWHAGRSAIALGFDAPLSRGGAIGLAIAVALLVAFAVAQFIGKLRHRTPDVKTEAKWLEDNAVLPRTRRELALFLVMAVLLGCGWEVLYRGFLLWLLVPHIGTIGAICVAAIAYGFAHGYKGHQQCTMAVAMAFAFTIAFVLTHSLWWLMLIHTAMPIIGGVTSYRLVRRPPPAASNAAPAASA